MVKGKYNNISLFQIITKYIIKLQQQLPKFTSNYILNKSNV